MVTGPPGARPTRTRPCRPPGSQARSRDSWATGWALADVTPACRQGRTAPGLPCFLTLQALLSPRDQPSAGEKLALLSDPFRGLEGKSRSCRHPCACVSTTQLARLSPLRRRELSDSRPPQARAWQRPSKVKSTQTPRRAAQAPGRKGDPAAQLTHSPCTRWPTGRGPHPPA